MPGQGCGRVVNRLRRSASALCCLLIPSLSPCNAISSLWTCLQTYYNTLYSCLGKPAHVLAFLLMTLLLFSLVEERWHDILGERVLCQLRRLLREVAAEQVLLNATVLGAPRSARHGFLHDEARGGDHPEAAV